VPDLSILKRAQREDSAEISRSGWNRIDEWASSIGLRLRLWDSVPVPRDRWIGVVVAEPDEEVADDFLDHCLVLARDRLLFDPACSVRPPPGMRPLTSDHFALDQITYGISFDSKEE
jgi:hypothetical protein